jgi:hypothetical protein
MSRFYEFNQTRKHRKEVQRIAKEKGYSFPFHDFIKMINILIFGDKIATKLHRALSSHHDQVVGEVYRYDDQGKKVHLRYIRDIENKVEAAIDWESARFTKPDKPLTAYQCWKKYYQDIDMKDTLKSLGFWEGK